MQPGNFHIADLDAGKILLNKLCFHFNKEKKYDPIEDCFKIHVDTKRDLIKFIDKTMEGKCSFDIDVLNRIIRDIKSKKFKKLIPSNNHTLRTLCFVVIKNEFPETKLKTENSKYGKNGATHAIEIYVSDFNKKFVETFLINLHQKELQTQDSKLSDTSWYMYMNDIDKKTKERKIGRYVVHFTKVTEGLAIKCITDKSNSKNWVGKAYTDGLTEYLLINLRRELNPERVMKIFIRLGIDTIPSVLYGEITFNTRVNKENFIRTNSILIKCSGDRTPSPATLKIGEDKLLKPVEKYLKDVLRNSIEFKLPIHDCIGQINSND